MTDATKKTDFRSKLESDVRENFVRDTTEHVVLALSEPGETAQLFRCGKPRSNIFTFYVCSTPGYLSLYGDMGACGWQRDRDMIAWASSAVGSLGYFAEKVPREFKIRQEYAELAREWFDEIKGEYIEGGRDWGEEEDSALETIKDEFSMHDDAGENFGALRNALFYSCLYHDCDDMPELEFYTYRFLWQREGIRWFCNKFYEGDFEIEKR